jgi:hypothetical protein
MLHNRVHACVVRAPPIHFTLKRSATVRFDTPPNTWFAYLSDLFYGTGYNEGAYCITAAEP